jgi:hypothetical protein
MGLIFNRYIINIFFIKDEERSEGKMRKSKKRNRRNVTIIRGQERRRRRAGEAGGSSTIIQNKYEGMKGENEDFKMIKTKIRAEA